MFKYLFTLLLAGTFSTAAFSQSDVAFTFGPKIGLNYRSLNHVGEGLSSPYKLGYTAGVFVRLKIDHFFIQPEANYVAFNSTVNATSTTNGNQTTIVFTETPNHLAVPVLLGGLIGSKKWNMRLYVAPVLMFKLKNTGDTKPNYNNSTWGYQGGVGFDLANITLDARYEGLFNATDEQNTTYLGQNIQGQYLLSVGFKVL